MASVPLSMKVLDTVLLSGVLVIVAVLPSDNVLVVMLNVVLESSLRILVQLIVAIGKPSAEQVRESRSGLRS